MLARLAVFADPWPGAVAIWALERRRELPAAGDWRGAVRCRRDARRFAGRAERALASARDSRAALWRRAGRQCPTRAAGRRQCGGGATRRWRLGGDPICPSRAGRRRTYAGVAAVARAGRQRTGDGAAAGGGRAFRDAGSAYGGDGQRYRRIGTAPCSCAWWPPTATIGDPTAFALEVTPQATALKPLGAGACQGRARRRRGRPSVGSAAPVSMATAGPAKCRSARTRERYEVDILSGATVLRTLSVTQPRALYAAADEMADFGSPQTSLSMRVMQLSATVGRGFAAKRLISDPPPSSVIPQVLKGHDRYRQSWAALHRRQPGAEARHP